MDDSSYIMHIFRLFYSGSISHLRFQLDSQLNMFSSNWWTDLLIRHSDDVHKKHLLTTFDTSPNSKYPNKLLWNQPLYNPSGLYFYDYYLMLNQHTIQSVRLVGKKCKTHKWSLTEVICYNDWDFDWNGPTNISLYLLKGIFKFHTHPPSQPIKN